MSRNKALSVLQKTYDDTYLSCSTAVYHESQVSASSSHSVRVNFQWALLNVFLG